MGMQAQPPQAIWKDSHHLRSLETRREHGHQRTEQKGDCELPQHHLEGRACQSQWILPPGQQGRVVVPLVRCLHHGANPTCAGGICPPGSEAKCASATPVRVGITPVKALVVTHALLTERHQTCLSSSAFLLHRLLSLPVTQDLSGPEHAVRSTIQEKRNTLSHNVGTIPFQT